MAVFTTGRLWCCRLALSCAQDLKLGREARKSAAHAVLAPAQVAVPRARGTGLDTLGALHDVHASCSIPLELSCSTQPSAAPVRCMLSALHAIEVHAQHPYRLVTDSQPF